MATNKNKSKIKNYFIAGFLFLIFFAPVFSFVYAVDPPKGTGIVTSCGGSSCDFNQLMLAVQKVVNWAIGFALSFSVIVLAIAGWKYMTSGDSPGNIAEANKMFVSVGKGIFFILAAWLIVNLIMTSLVKPEMVTNYITN